MNPEYQELVSHVSHHVAQVFLEHETDLARRATLFDADIAEISRQIGLETTKLVLTRILDDLAAVHQQAGLTCQHRPMIKYNVVFGCLELPSPYLWKKGAHAKPLRDEMGITHHGRSEAVTRALSDFGIEESFGQASKRFTEHYHFPLSSSTASRVTKQVAQEAHVYLEQKLATVEQDDTEEIEAVSPCERILVELDACKIRTATFEENDSSDERTPVYNNPKKRKVLQWRDVRMGLSRPLEAHSKTYVGKMGSYPEVVDQLFQASVLNGMAEETPVIGVADGGIGLKEALEGRFDNLQFILDKTHLKDHLYETAEELGIGKDERPAWVHTRLKTVSRGDVAQVKQEFETLYEQCPHPRLKRVIGYVTRFYDAVDYEHFKAQGYPIGSGEIESSHKSVPQKRLKLPGACWAPESINPMLSLRILRANDWWDEFWEDRTKRKTAA
jgi:hypothetical protein